MHFDYEVKISDNVAANMRLLERSETARRWRRKGRVISVIVAVTPAFFFAIVLTGVAGATGLLVGVPIAVAAGVMVWLLHPRMYRDRLRRRFTEYFRGKDSRTSLGPRHLELSDAGLTITTPDAEWLFRWPGVTALVVANDRCFIDLPNAQLAVPLREFSDSQRQELLQELVRHLDSVEHEQQDVLR